MHGLDVGVDSWWPGGVSEPLRGEEYVHVKELSGMGVVRRASTRLEVVISAVEESLH